MAAEVEDVTLRILRDMQQEQKQMRRDYPQVREMPGALGQTLRRNEAHLDSRLLPLETRLAEARSDVEATLKLEVGGQLADFATRNEAQLEGFLAEISAQMSERPKTRRREDVKTWALPLG